MKKLSILLFAITMSVSMCACGSKENHSDIVSNSQENNFDFENNSQENEKEVEMTYYEFGETALVNNGNVEITLKSYDYVENVYEYGDVTRVESFSRTTPSDENCLIRVVYTLKNVGKEAIKKNVTFGYIDYDNGYKFECANPVGIHLTSCGNTVSKTSVGVTLQPLSEEVEVVSFLEVPKTIQEDKTKALLWSDYEVIYKIR